MAYEQFCTAGYLLMCYVLDNIVDNQISLIKMELAFLSGRLLGEFLLCGISLYKIDLEYITFKSNQKLDQL